MRAVDTNALVRLVTRNDRKQVAAAESFVSKGAWVSMLALMEATWILTAVYELTHTQMSTAPRRDGPALPLSADHGRWNYSRWRLGGYRLGMTAGREN